MNNDYVFTVFTATFNRRDKLINLYNDLKRQTFKNFEWLIVDDGSTDETGIIVNEWIKENVIQIKYIYKENGGKHTAINVGVRESKGELFFLADSDDRLVESGLKIMLDTWNSIRNKGEFCGVAGLFMYQNGDIVGTKFDEKYLEVPFTDVYKKYNTKGDKTVFFTTKVMKEYPFPEKEGMQFIMESVVWDEISKKYKMKCINEIIQIKEYLDDGLTKSSYSNRILNGLAYSYLILINQNTYEISKFPKDKIWNYINLVSHSLLVGKNYIKDINRIFDKFMYVLCFPRGYISYIRMNKYKKNI